MSFPTPSLPGAMIAHMPRCCLSGHAQELCALGGMMVSGLCVLAAASRRLSRWQGMQEG